MQKTCSGFAINTKMLTIVVQASFHTELFAADVITNEHHARNTTVTLPGIASTSERFPSSSTSTDTSTPRKKREADPQWGGAAV